MARTRTALLKTSGYTDVKSSGGVINITGLDPISRKDIVKINQFKYRAEVVKVETIGTSAPTPQASTKYIVEITDSTSSRQGVSNAIVPRKYVYKTPADLTELGATAALQREAIYGGLITKINDDTANNVVAVSLGSGTGFTITDDAGYYPAKTAGGQNPRQGKTSIYLPKDENGRGFIDATHRVLTTDATYQFGTGARMLQDIPVVYALGGSNIVAGELDAPLASDGSGAVSGQQYVGFAIQHLVQSEIPTIGEARGYRVANQMVFVDNGKGTSTANATAFTNATTQALGFTPFERAMHKLIFGVYKDDESTTIEFFDKPIVMTAAIGVSPYTGTLATTADLLNTLISPYGSIQHTNIGTQTIFAPAQNDLGLLIDQDDAAGEGAHYAVTAKALNRQEFIVGNTGFSMVCKVVMGDWTDSHFLAGFRTKAVYTADFNDYTQMAAAGSGAAAGDTITTTGILANAATVATASAASYVDAVPSEIRIHVAVDGTVTAYVDNVKYPIYSAGTTALVFAAGTVLIPFFQHVNIGSGDPAVVVSEFVAIADNNWKIDA